MLVVYKQVAYKKVNVLVFDEITFEKFLNEYKWKTSMAQFLVKLQLQILDFTDDGIH